jgi:hypothetical protein
VGQKVCLLAIVLFVTIMMSFGFGASYRLHYGSAGP